MTSPHRRLATGLTDAQHDAVFSDAARLCIVAGAGSGKTLVLTRRIARVLADDPAAAAHTVAVTFTRKAAGELTGRLDALGAGDDLRCGTFHALAYRAINEHRRLRGLPERHVVEHKATLVAEVMRGPRGRSADRRRVRAVATEIERARARAVAPDELAASLGGRDLPLPPAELARIYAAYTELKAHRGVLDFEDLLEGWATILEQDPSFARAPVRRVDHVFVDEFQDVNAAQFRLLRALVDSAPPPQRTTLCVVGDDDQSIYGFGGAEAAYLVGFHELWPDAVTVRLEDNFRCPPQVLEVANAVLSEGRGRHGKLLRPNLADGPAPELRAHPDEVAEAAWVARTLARARRPGASWRSCAVLARTNRQLEPIRDALAASGIPAAVRTGTALMASPQVRDLLDRLRNAERQGSLPPGMPFAVLVAELAGCEAGEDLTDLGCRLEPDLAAVVEAAVDYELTALDTGATTDADGFTLWLRTTVGAEPGDSDADAVSLLSMHRAKGLEFDVVFVVGLEEGLMPIAHAASPADVEEERRLLYVALTRSRRRLLLSWCREREIGGEARRRRPSRMLATVTATLEASAAADSAAPGWRSWLARARAGVTVAGASGSGESADATGAGRDDVLLARLREWRVQTAAREGIPAHLVAHDATLRQLARVRPTDQSELARVPDLGALKRMRYGSELLDVVATCEALSASRRA
ncbi:MAG: ATP-dependent DNA helicase UvrD2 [Acidimicrobiia bacterium]|nr:ATP-dependent DNA helicase UvrD2 [Acidimicrobiia bacterium]